MSELIKYAIAGGPPDNWNQLGVKWNGVEVVEVVEANVEEGWLKAYARDLNGKLILDEDGKSFKQATIWGDIEIFVKPKVN